MAGELARSAPGRSPAFFFQAEDGIRDYKVTGVQTCALPICHGDGRLGLASTLTLEDRHGQGLLHTTRRGRPGARSRRGARDRAPACGGREGRQGRRRERRDRKSTRLNSSHLVISYAVFCLQKKIVT